MQLFAIISAMLVAATAVVAVPQSIGIIPSGNPCLVTLPEFCASGVCDAGAGATGALVGVRVPLHLQKVILTYFTRLASEMKMICSRSWGIACMGREIPILF